jgi:hypothetical protein
VGGKDDMDAQVGVSSFQVDVETFDMLVSSSSCFLILILLCSCSCLAIFYALYVLRIFPLPFAVASMSGH